MDTDYCMNNRGRSITRNHPEGPPEDTSHLRERVSMLLSRWHGLQLAVENQWGGSNSLQKSQQLIADIVSWFSHSATAIKPSVEDLESLLHESMLLTFNTEIEDGSIEEIAEQLMILHEDYLQGRHSSAMRHT